VIANGGFAEDSASYEVDVVWPGLLQLSSEMERRREQDGDVDFDPILDRPPFRRLIDRLFDHTAPLGFVPGYGDTSGMGFASPGQIWLFEEAANHYGAPRFRWLADRLRDFRRGRVPAEESNRLWYLAFADRARRRSEVDSRAPLARRSIESEEASAAREGAVDLEPGSTLSQRVSVRGDGLTALRVFVEAADAEAALRIEVEPIAEQPDNRFIRTDWSYDETVPVAAGPVEVFPFLPGVSEVEVRIRSAAGRVRLATELSPEASSPNPESGVRRASTDPKVLLGLSVLDGEGSSITYRPEVRLRPRREWGEPKSPWEFTGREVPDKLVLRSGFETHELFGLIDLVSGQSHDSAGVGGLVSLVDQEAILLAPTAVPYWGFEKHARHENSVVFDGLAESPGTAAEILEFHDSPVLTVAHFRWGNRSGVSHERRVIFVKNRFVWIRDRLDRGSMSRLPVRVNWHAERVSALEGGRGFMLSMPSIWFGAYRVTNPSADLFLHVTPFEGLSVLSVHVKEYDPPADCPDVQRSSRKRSIDCIDRPTWVVQGRHENREGIPDTRVVWIDSLLVPGPTEKGELGDPRVLSSGKDGSSSWLEIASNGERWLIVDNPDGRMIRSGAVGTDARNVVSLRRADGPEGSPVVLSIRASTFFDHEGGSRTYGLPSSVESGRLPAR
jgi:hypothetical protein